MCRLTPLSLSTHQSPQLKLCNPMTIRVSLPRVFIGRGSTLQIDIYIYQKPRREIMVINKPRYRDALSSVNSVELESLSDVRATVGFAIRGVAYCQLQLRKGVHVLLCRSSRSCSCQRVNGACARKRVGVDMEVVVRKTWAAESLKSGPKWHYSLLSFLFDGTYETRVSCLLD